MSPPAPIVPAASPLADAIRDWPARARERAAFIRGLLGDVDPHAECTCERHVDVPVDIE